MRDVAERFHIVHHRRTLIEALHRRKGGPDPWLAPLPLERLDESRFFSTNIGACPSMEVDIQIEIASQDLLSEEAVRIRLLEGPFQDRDRLQELTAKIDIRSLGPNGVAGNDNPLEDLVGVPLQELPIFEGSGFSLIGIAEEIFRYSRILGNKPPFHPGWKAGTPPPPKAGSFDHLDDL